MRLVGACIFVGIILLLAVLLFSSATLRVSCQNSSFKLEARYLFLKFPISLDKAEEKAKGKGKEKKAELSKEEKAKAKKEKTPLSESVSRIWELISAFAKDLGILLSKFRIYDLTLRVVISGEDAADTGIRYGNLCAYVYSGLATLQGILTLRRVGTIQLTPNFSGCDAPDQEPHTDYFFSFALKLRVASVLRAVLSGLVKYLRQTMRRQKEETQPASKKDSVISGSH